jgi:hypothetical protein
MIRKHMIAAAAALALGAAGAQAVTFEGYTAGAGTLVEDFSGPGLLSFDIDFANFVPAVLDYRIDEGDLGMPVTFNAIVRNFTGQGLEFLSFTLSQGSFSTVGTVTRLFGGAAPSVGGPGAVVAISFDPPEFLDLEIGNVLGTTAGALDWRIDNTAFTAGDRFSITVAIPEPGTYALMGAGLGLVGWLARRRSRAQ